MLHIHFNVINRIFLFRIFYYIIPIYLFISFKILIGLLCLTLHLLSDCRLHMKSYHAMAHFLNYMATTAAFVITVLNLVISCFDPTIARYAVFEAPDVTALGQ